METRNVTDSVAYPLTVIINDSKPGKVEVTDANGHKLGHLYLINIDCGKESIEILAVNTLGTDLKS
ncbi:MAG: hypothetical protein WC783_04340 [Candidatus Paceibacterota bacterium]